MLEDYTMDKKPTARSGQGPSKGNCTESKKNQDATNGGKQYPKSGRKREPSSFSNGPKYDQNRKPQPQKSKAFDKRPKPRGFNCGGGKESSQINGDYFNAEFGSLYATGSKKQSLTHLLNFHYEPRGENVSSRAQPTQQSYSTKSLMATQTHKYNKEQFLQANCQFVVREGGDYTFNLGDPDLLVEWDSIELIVFPEKVACPICLYSPVAGKITRCGHIFCWSCILHYLSLSDENYRKCPICYESVYKSKLKSVQCLDRASFSVGDEITLQLMKREKRTLLASPVDQFSSRTLVPILSYGETQLNTTYSKLLTASKEKVVEIIDQEYVDLQSQVEEFRGCPELCFVEQALVHLAERKSEVTGEVKKTIKGDANSINCPTNDGPIATESSGVGEGATCPPESEQAVQNKTEVEDKSRQRSESNSTYSESDEQTITAEDLEIDNLNHGANNSTKYFYFYQASDGQQIYLHSINVKTLEACYGSLEQCPAQITGRILEQEPGSMTLQLRKRLRYLEHVPITCAFDVIELDLKPPLVTHEALALFQAQIDERRKRRQIQARKEEKWGRRVEEMEMMRYKRLPTPNLRIESDLHFPQFGLEDMARTPTLTNMPPVSSSSHNRSPSPMNFPSMSESENLEAKVESLSISEESNIGGGPSFAQMLRDGKTAAGPGGLWPTISSGGSGSNTVWGNESSSSGAWPRRQRQASVNQELADSDSDSPFSPPARPSFNIAEAIQATLEKGDINNSSNGSSTGRKKNKKKQKIVLFSTGIPKGN